LEKEVEDSFDCSIVSEKDMIKQGYALDVFDVFGDDPYTIPIIMLTKAWMEAVEERDRMHLWKYVKSAYQELDNGYDIIDHTYRRVMANLMKREVVKPIQIQKGRRPKYDYELTAYGKAVCEKLEQSVHEQIRLKNWRRRACCLQETRVI
jgi:hypothetical protein